MSMRNRQISLKPQDLLVLFKLAARIEVAFAYARFSQKLGISASELHASIARLVLSRLVILADNRVTLVRPGLYEFVIHGAVHFFPPITGSATRGIPTGYAAPPLSEKIGQSKEMPPVWPDPKGSVRGITLYPIYPSVPKVALDDPELYENLALFDALRAGAARDREIARQLLRERL